MHQLHEFWRLLFKLIRVVFIRVAFGRAHLDLLRQWTKGADKAIPRRGPSITCKAIVITVSHYNTSCAYQDMLCTVFWATTPWAFRSTNKSKANGPPRSSTISGDSTWSNNTTCICQDFCPVVPNDRSAPSVSVPRSGEAP